MVYFEILIPDVVDFSALLMLVLGCQAYEAAIANRKAAAFRFESIENLIEDVKVQRDTLVKV